MTIDVSEDVARSIQAAVQSGRFPSVEEAVSAAWVALTRQPQPAQAEPQTPVATPQTKPIWERIQDLTADVPAEEWDKLPTDLADQHDHYLYGTPKHEPR